MDEKPKEVLVYNPDTEDFHFQYDINGTQNPVKYVLHAGEIGKYPEYLGNHAKKHLATKLVHKRGGWVKSGFDNEYDKVMKEISVKL
jgi:hypothetical protein